MPDQPYKRWAATSVGVTLSPELVGAQRDVLWDAHRRHIAQAASAGRGQFGADNHRALATRLKVLGRELESSP